jgi:hypothetical protein
MFLVPKNHYCNLLLHSLFYKKLFLWKITGFSKKLRNFQYWLKSKKLDKKFLFQFHADVWKFDLFYEIGMKIKKFSLLGTFKKFLKKSV